VVSGGRGASSRKLVQKKTEFASDREGPRFPTAGPHPWFCVRVSLKESRTKFVDLNDAYRKSGRKA
jgi:hypothetical protein